MAVRGEVVAVGRRIELGTRDGILFVERSKDSEKN